MKGFKLTVWVETAKHFHPHGNVGVPFLGPHLKVASVQESVKLVLYRCVAVKVSKEHLKRQYKYVSNGQHEDINISCLRIPPKG